jgi:hypothetical protein
LSEAKSRGYDVTGESLSESAKWTKDRLLERIDLPRDKRPGWGMVNTPSLYLSLMAICVPAQDAVSADELKRIAGHLLRHQEDDGSWAWSSAPPKNRPPPVFESDEVATLLGFLALGPQVPDDPSEKSPIRDAREKAANWLAKTEPADTTQAAALRLLVAVQSGKPEKERLSEIDRFLRRRNDDGGWGQIPKAPSDAYATGQALYVLDLWPITPRSHAGAEPSKNPVPITYFGSAWATLGLMRSLPRPDPRRSAP